MPTRYQFSCPHCEHSFELVTTQAGQEITCPQCNQTSEAPKLGVMKSLPVIGGQPGTRKKPRGNNILATMGLGLAILFGAAGGALYYYGNSMIVEVDYEGRISSYAKEVEEAPPEAVVAEFARMREQGLGEWREPTAVRYNHQGNILRYTAIGLLAVAVAGVIMFLMGMFSKK